MPDYPSTLPCPPFSHRIGLPGDAATPLDLAALPARPGVFVFEDAGGGTIAIVATANLRRLVASKLAAPDPGAVLSRKIDYQSVTRSVAAVTVGSGFEADWAYLQLARTRMPATYRGMLDRRQSWFVQCDPAAEFPQWTKTAHPKSTAADAVAAHGSCFGPIPDKHAAGRYIEMLEDAFDLCRYHHILVQAPHGTACAYKEMGRCPAPCDGTISMDAYRSQIDASIEFAGTPIEQFRRRVETAMQGASTQLDFERAARARALLDRISVAAKSEFRFIDRLENFAFVAVAPAERKPHVRLFLIRGGWIEPFADVPAQSNAASIGDVVDEIKHRAVVQPIDFCNAGLENISLVCWHLFQKRAARHAVEFVQLSDDVDASTLARAVRRVGRSESADDQAADITEQDLDNLAGQ